jgi:SAM-dependent methyltransferase
LAAGIGRSAAHEVLGGLNVTDHVLHDRGVGVAVGDNRLPWDSVNPPGDKPRRRRAGPCDLEDSVISAMANVGGYDNCKIIKADITNFRSEGYDVVYCIGVIHHLKVPRDGFESVIKNTKKGGKFHMWVYAREGNALIIYIVDPIRKITSKLPWFITKYLVATPLAIPFYIYAKLIRYLKGISIFKHLPLYQYGLWISDREFVFFQHVAFDQLVTPQTTYISKEVIVDWLKSMPEIDQSSTYVIMRNGNSWKFGGVVN